MSQMLSPYMRRQIANRAKDAVNHSSINQDDVRSFSVRLPPIAAQRRWVEFIREQRRQVRRLGAFGREADRLFSSLLHRAFTGTL